MDTLYLTPDEVLSTTRAVRRRMDLTRPVEHQVLEECLTLAQQAPRASNIESRRFVVVTNPEKRAALADLWRRGYEWYVGRAQDGRQGSRRAIGGAGRRSVEHLSGSLVLRFAFAVAEGGG